MIQDFRVGDYRGLNGLSVEGLRRVNLITGGNGVGKTALLEALWAFAGRYSPQDLWKSQVQRTARAPVDPVAGLARTAIALAGTEGGRASEVRVEFESGVPLAGGNGNSFAAAARAVGVEPEDLPVTVQFEKPRIHGRLRLHLDGEEIREPLRPFRPPTGNGVVLVPAPKRAIERPPAIIDLPSTTFDLPEASVHRFSSIVRQGKKDEVLRRLHRILPLVNDLEIVMTDDGAPYLMATTNDNERMELQFLGGGMTRLSRIYTHFYSVAGGGIVLLDEVENELHRSVVEKLWGDLRAMAEEFDIQVFATTHSMESIDAAVDAFESSLGDLAVFGLYRPSDEEGARAVMFSDDRLRAAMEVGWDLR